MVLEAGLEPAWPQWPKDFKSFVSTIPPFELIGDFEGFCDGKGRNFFYNMQVYRPITA